MSYLRQSAIRRSAGPSPDRPLVILGAGLAGLSLACALIDAGCPAPVILLDQRRSWSRDRTWCTWQTPELAVDHCVTHAWSSWRLSAADRVIEHHSSRHPYVHIDAGRFYAAALERIDAAPGVELRAGVIVHAVESATPGSDPRPARSSHRPGAVPWDAPLTVLTDAGPIEAGVVFDAMGPRSPLSAVPEPLAGLVQRFLGWEVETTRPIFDPGLATLMDFRPHAPGGVHFIYALPFTPTRALIEHTSIEAPDHPATDRVTALEEELERRGAGGHGVLYTEQAEISMSPAAHPARLASGVYTVGTTAGAVRPSSGYAFTRTQHHVTQIVRALRQGRPIPAQPTRLRHVGMDRVFLAAIARAPQPEQLFLDTAAAGAEPFARFMTDTSTPRDELALLRRLPAGTMLAATARTLVSSSP